MGHGRDTIQYLMIGDALTSFYEYLEDNAQCSSIFGDLHKKFGREIMPYVWAHGKNPGEKKNEVVRGKSKKWVASDK